MNKRVNEKIEEIEQYLAELIDIFPETLQEYKRNKLVKAACERYVEKIMEAVTDLSFILISIKKLELPQDDIDSFRILFDNKIINKSLYAKLKAAKGMRNVIAHQYGSVNDEIVFDSIKDELEEDVRTFLRELKKLNDSAI
ncbi:MAG: DUF86 domain-containing protein [Nanoarchaeota archaeon]